MTKQRLQVPAAHQKATPSMKHWTNDEAINRWAAFPREVLESMEPDGDFGRRHLLNPVLLRMLGDVSERRILDAGFVFSLVHPCFEQLAPSWRAHGEYRLGAYLAEYEIPWPYASSFHRPLSAYLNTVT